MSRKYLDSRLPTDARLDDLLSQMTLEEKIAQLKSRFIHIPQVFDPVMRRLDPGQSEKFRHHLNRMSWNVYQEDRQIHNALLGSTWKEQWRDRVMDRDGIAVGELSLALEFFPPEEGAAFGNEMQAYVLEHSRLKIPLLVHDECLHGCLAWGSSSYPQSIGMAATFNPDLYGEVAKAIGRETRSRGIHQCLSPTINLARDARSGRTEETYGEDTYLSARLAAAFVIGVQSEGVAATPKHYIANFVGNGGRDSNQTNFSERHLREIYLPVFRAAIEEAGALSIMAAYGALDSVPCHANHWLLTKILRDEWGFKGFVVSDYDALPRMVSRLHVAADWPEAAARAIQAGMDMELPTSDCYDHLADLVSAGTVPESVIDQSTRRVLYAKFKLGLFDSIEANPAKAKVINDSAEHRALARKAAQESMTLLKNDGVLPISPSMIQVAAIGPNADRANLGEYTGAGMEVVTPLAGLQAAASSEVRITHVSGCTVTGTSKDGFPGAVEVACQADVAILFMGDSYETQGEGRDRSSLSLPGVQEELILEIAATGTPVVVVLLSGGAVICERWIDEVAAILHAWYPGEEGGTAVADTLLGTACPAGRLPITVPKSEGQLPLYYNHEPSGRGLNYVDLRDNEGRFPFGFGLSYTTFAYADLEVTPVEIVGADLQPAAAGDSRAAPADGPLSVSFTLTNTGDCAGDEVAQLYVRDPVSSRTRPEKLLRRFKRITMDPGVSERLAFSLGYDDLSYLDGDMKSFVEPGEFEIQIGASSADIRLSTIITVT